MAKPEFSYESDVAPLRGDFFPTSPASNLTGVALDEEIYLGKRYGEKIARQYDEVATRRSREATFQSQQLAFERQKLALEKAKREAAEEIEFNERAPQLLSGIGNVMESSDSTEGKLDKMLLLQQNNPRAFSKNNVASQAFNAAMGRLSLQERIESRERSEEEKRLTGLNRWAVAGATDVVKRRAGEEIDPKEADLIADAEYVRKSSLRDQQSKRSRILSDKALENEQSFIDKSYTTLSTLTDDDGDELDFDSLNKPKSNGSKDLKLSPKSRRALLILLARLNGKSVTSMGKYSDVDLFDTASAALARRNQGLNSYIGEAAPQGPQKPRSKAASAFQ